MKQQFSKKKQTARQETAQRALKLQRPSRRTISLDSQPQKITESNHGFIRHNGNTVYEVALKHRKALGRQSVHENGTVNALNLGAYIAREQKSGRPLQKNMHGKMQKLFGRDFSDVRMHIDSGAREACKSLSVTAFTVSNHIFFRTVAPDRVLIAHELTHVAQQKKGRVGLREGGKTKRSDPAEQEAIQVAYAVARHQPLPEISQEIFASTIAGEWGPMREIIQPDWVQTAESDPSVVLRVQVESFAGYIRLQFYNSATDNHYMPLGDSISEIEGLVGPQTISSIEEYFGIGIGEFYELDFEGGWIVYRLREFDQSTLSLAGLISPQEVEVESRERAEEDDGEERSPQEVYDQIGYLEEELEVLPERAETIQPMLDSLEREMREIEEWEIQRQQPLCPLDMPGPWVSGWGERWRFQSGRLRLLGVPGEESLEQAPRGPIESREPPTIIDEPLSNRPDPEGFLVGEFRDILQDWHRGTIQGTMGFGDNVLANLGTVDTELFLTRLIGNIIWAGSAFASGTALPFAISLFGISVNMSRDWPNVETVSNLESVNNMIMAYFNHIWGALQDAIPQIARRFVEIYSTTVTVRFMKEVFLFRSFDWDVIDIEGDPNVSLGTVADKVRQKANELLITYQRLETVGSRVGYFPNPTAVTEVRNRVKWIIYPNDARALALVAESWTHYVTSRNAFTYRFLRFIPSQLRELAIERERATGRGRVVGELRNDEVVGVPPPPLENL